MEKESWSWLRARLKQAFMVAATIVIVALLAQSLPFDLAIWFSGEILLYLEVVSSVWIASRVANLRSAVAWTRAFFRRRFRPRDRDPRSLSARRRRPDRQSDDPERPAFAARLALAA